MAAWDKIPETLVQKAFKLCGYFNGMTPTVDASIMTQYESRARVAVREEIGEDAVKFLEDPENDPALEEGLDKYGLFPADD